MKITEKMLLDNFAGITNGLDNISKINNETIWWNYRRGNNGDEFNPVVAKREDAEEISLENTKMETVEINAENENHPSLAKIAQLRKKACGTEI